MLKTEKESIILPSLQNSIVRHLTESEPQTINQTCQKLRKQYKATYYSFESLTKKGLVSQKDTIDYRGRKFPRYWLTNKGILTALTAGMNSKKFTSNIERFGNLGNNPAPFVFLANSLESDSPVVRARSKELISFLLSRMTEAAEKEQTIERTKEMLNEERKFYEDLEKQFPELSFLLDAMKAVETLFAIFLKKVIQQPSGELSPQEGAPIEEITLAEASPIEELDEEEKGQQGDT